MTCHFWGTTRERWSHGKQRLKRWVLRRLRVRKMASDGADVTCCGRLLQVRGAATEKARSPTVDIRVRRTICVPRRNADDNELRCLLAGIVRRRGTAVLHLADTCSCIQGEPACNQSAPPPSTNVVDGGLGRCARLLVPRRGKHQPISGIHHWLKLLQQVQRNAGESGISVIQPRQNEWRHQQLEQNTKNGSRNGLADALQLTQIGESGRDGLHNVWPHRDVGVDVYTEVTNDRSWRNFVSAN